MGNKVSSRSQRKSVNSSSSSAAAAPLSSAPASAVFGFSSRFQLHSAKVKKQKGAKEKKAKSGLLIKRISKEKKSLAPFLTCDPPSPPVLRETGCKFQDPKKDFFSLNTQEATLQLENEIQTSVADTKTSYCCADFPDSSEQQTVCCKSRLNCASSSSPASDHECCNDNSVIMTAGKASDESTCLLRRNSCSRNSVLSDEKVNSAISLNKDDARSFEQEQKPVNSLQNNIDFQSNNEKSEASKHLEIDFNFLPVTSSTDSYAAEDEVPHREADDTLLLQSKIEDKCNKEDEGEGHLDEFSSEISDKLHYSELYVESNKKELCSLVVTECDLSKVTEEKAYSFYLENEKKEAKNKAEKCAKVCEENSASSSTTYTSVISSCIESPRSSSQSNMSKEKQKDLLDSVDKKHVGNSSEYRMTSACEENANVKSSVDFNDEFSPNFLMEPTRAIQMWFSDILFSCAANNNSNEEGFVRTGDNQSTELVIVDDVTGYLADAKSTITFCDESAATPHMSPSNDNKKSCFYYSNSQASNNSANVSSDFTSSSTANSHKSSSYEHYNIATPTSSRRCLRATDDTYNFSKNKSDSTRDDENILYFLPSEDPTGYLTDLAS